MVIYVFMVALNVIAWSDSSGLHTKVCLIWTINSVQSEDSFTVKVLSSGYPRAQILQQEIK